MKPGNGDPFRGAPPVKGHGSRVRDWITDCLPLMFSHSRGLASKLFFVFSLSNAHVLHLRLLRFYLAKVHDWIYLRERRKKMDLVPLDIPLRRPVKFKTKPLSVMQKENVFSPLCALALRAAGGWRGF